MTIFADIKTHGWIRVWDLLPYAHTPLVFKRLMTFLNLYTSDDFFFNYCFLYGSQHREHHDAGTWWQLKYWMMSSQIIFVKPCEVNCEPRSFTTREGYTKMERATFFAAVVIYLISTTYCMSERRWTAQECRQ